MVEQSILPIIVGSAVVAAIVSGVFQLAAEALRRRATREDRLERLSAETAVRREEANAVARDGLLPLLLAAISFVDDQHRGGVEDQVGIQVVAHPQFESTVSSWGEVLGGLRRTSLAHPEREIRTEAREIQKSIQSAFVDPHPGEPNTEQLNDWLNRLRELVESMHVS